MGILDNYFDPKTMAQLKTLSAPSEDEKKSALNSALLTAGLGMMANSNNMGGRFGTAVGAGGLMGAQQYQSAIQQQQKDQIELLQQGMMFQKLKADQRAQDNQEKFAGRFSELLSPQGPQQAVPYQDKITAAQAGSNGLPTVSTEAASPDNAQAYFRSAIKIVDPMQKQAAIEAGLRQWPDYRQALAQAPVQQPTQDISARMALLGAEGGLRGIKGAHELISAAKQLEAQKRDAGSTYINPLTGVETYYAKLPEGMEKVGGVVQNLRNYTSALAQQEGAKIGAQEAAKAPYGSPEVLKGAGQGGSDLIIPKVNVPQLNGKITTASPADVEYAKEGAKTSSEQMKGIQTAGLQAPGKIAKYQQLGKLLEGYEGGALSASGMHLAQTANSLGLKIDKDLPNKEAAASLTNQLALSLRSTANGEGMPGAMSDADRNFLMSSVPSLSQTAQGRRQMVDMQVAIHQRDQDVSSMARKWQQKYGRIDAVNPNSGKGFFDNLNEWSSANPLFGKK